MASCPQCLMGAQKNACIFLADTVGKGQTKGQTRREMSFEDSADTKSIKKWLVRKKKSQNPKILTRFLWQRVKDSNYPSDHFILPFIHNMLCFIRKVPILCA